MSTTQTDRDARIQAARESFTGRSLTQSQFKEAWAISSVISQEIRKTGSFREKLTDYAHAFSRSERFDALRGEAIIRDIYIARYQQSMNQTREALMARDEAITDIARARALTIAETIGDLIQKAPTQPFYQAYDRAAVTLSKELDITQSAAKAMMKEEYKANHGRDLYEVGKEMEEAYHKPVREAEIAARKAEKLETRSQSRAQER